MNKGKLIKVELQPGRFVKMYEADAIEQGYIKPAQKMKPAAENKMRPAAETKQPEPVAAVQPDDFTVIDGIGPATARAIQARGIKTFDELRQAQDLSFLSATACQAIERWK